MVTIKTIVLEIYTPAKLPACVRCGSVKRESVDSKGTVKASQFEFYNITLHNYKGRQLARCPNECKQTNQFFILLCTDNYRVKLIIIATAMLVVRPNLLITSLTFPN